MRTRTGLLLFLCVLAALLGLSSFQAKADMPAFREREIWRQDLTTTADLLTSSLTPLTRGVVGTKSSSTTYRFFIAIESGKADSIVYLRVKNVVAATTLNFAVNSGTALTNGNAYTFAFNATSGYEYNFRVGTNTTLGIFSIDRVDGGVDVQ